MRMGFFAGIWKIKIPKASIIKIVEAIDEDQDGYICIGEIKSLLKRYAKDVLTSFKLQRK